MAGKTCPTAGKANVQRLFVELEDVAGQLQRPTPQGRVMPAGQATMNQTPDYTNSDVLSESLDVIDQFQNAVGPGEISVPTLVQLPSDGSRPQGHALFAALMGNFQDPGTVTAVIDAQDTAIPAGVTPEATSIPFTGSSGFFPASGTIRIGGENIVYTGIDSTTFTGCTRGQGGTVAAAHDDGAAVTLTLAAAVNAAGGISDTDTEIPFDGSSGPFPTSGTVTIGDEQIAYTGISDGNTLTGCTRGENGTTAEAHADDAPIALTLTAMVNAPEQVLNGSIAADATRIPVKVVSGGFLPRRGVVAVEDEKIRYTGVTADAQGAVTALIGCTRGYARTVAAAHVDDTPLTLNSRVYFWDTCRYNVSVWLQIDHTVLFGSGAVVTQATIPMSNAGGQHCDFTLQFRRMGWCGRSYLSAAPAGAMLSVRTVDGKNAVDAYTEGGLLKNTTRRDDNSGTGYTITAVDKEAGTISISPAPSGWTEDDQLDPWLPEADPIGKAVESRSIRVFVDGIAGKLTEGSISIGTPTAFTDEIGDDYPGENADTTRDITMDNGLIFRAQDAVELGRGYAGYDLPIDVVIGNKAFGTLAMSMPRVKFNMPSIGTSDAFVTLTRTGAVLGTKGNDSLYIIQE